MSVATKFGRVVIYNKMLPLIKLHDPLITWFCEVRRQINLHYHNVYGHQSCRLVTYCKNIPPRNLHELVLLSHVTMHYISNCRGSTDTKIAN